MRWVTGQSELTISLDSVFVVIKEFQEEVARAYNSAGFLYFSKFIRQMMILVEHEGIV